MDACVLWARAGIAGVLAFVVGVVGHVSADGLLPEPTLPAALLVGSVLLSARCPTDRHRRCRWSLLVGGQTFIHLVLSVAAGRAGDQPAAGTGRTPVSGALGTLPSIDGHRVGSVQDAYQGTAGQPSSMAPALSVGHLINDMTAHTPMMAVHLVAAAVVGLWLAHGEGCLWTIIGVTGRRPFAASCALAAPVVLPPLRLSTTVDRAPWARSLWFVRPHLRREPLLLAV